MKKHGGYAFPVSQSVEDGGVSGGIYIRDWFAGQALTKLAGWDNGVFSDIEKANKRYAYIIARQAYLIADAMIEEREKL